ncbi:MAG: DUF6262 family protein [Lachnospiraceae bacterium]
MDMSKYSKMVESNQKASKEKIDRAIRTIKEMLDKEEQNFLVCGTRGPENRIVKSFSFLLRKSASVQASFFLNEARQKQEGKVFHQKKKVILDYALERQNELIKMEYEKSQKENKDLKAENEKLKKALRKKEVAFIKGL